MTKELSKRQMIREKRAREVTRNRLISIGAMVVGALVLFFMILWPNLQPVEFTEITSIERPNVNDNSTGNADAPITITEYSDFQCPYCARFWQETEDQLVKAYVETGKARFVYRSFGAFIGAESGAAAEAAYCAGEQGKFWEMHDIIFANQTGENVGAYTDRRLSAFAESIGLEMGAYNSCVNSGKFGDRVTQDGIDGINAGIQATPSFIISYVVNGETKTRLIEGAQGFAQFQTEIDAALAEIAAAQ